jgi:hypothetical protein
MAIVFVPDHPDLEGSRFYLSSTYSNVGFWQILLRKSVAGFFGQ